MKLKNREMMILLILGIILFLVISGESTNIYNGLQNLIGEDVTDTDGDGMPDTWEVLYNLDPDDGTDANQDSDGDGYTNLQEYQQGTNPLLASDHPGGDGVETKVYVTVYSDATLVPGIEVNLDVLPYDGYHIAYTNNEGLATFSSIPSGNYALFAKIDDDWKGGDAITVQEGSNHFTFHYYPSSDTWKVE